MSALPKAPSHAYKSSYSDGFMARNGSSMGFSPKPENYGNVFRRLSDVRTLYGSPLQAPTVFYKDNDATPYQYPDDLQ